LPHPALSFEEVLQTKERVKNRNEAQVLSFGEDLGEAGKDFLK
jgi:hypothetical protein